MVALIVSYFFLAYLFAPRAIFRLGSASLPLKFQRTRTEEITFACLISLIPLLLALALTTNRWGLPIFGSWIDYEEVFSASYSERIFNKNPDQFWISVRHLLNGQAEFLLFIYYPLVVVETAVFVKLVSSYGDWRGRFFVYDWVAQQALLRGVNEWYLLLTAFNFSKSPKRKVEADILTDDDHLYQGEIAQHFIDYEGVLSGLILTSPRRFDRPGYLREKQKQDSADIVLADPYWKDIPSAALYIARDKIVSLNLRYPTANTMPSEGTDAAEAVTKELQREGIELKIELPTEEASASGPAKTPRSSSQSD